MRIYKKKLISLRSYVRTFKQLIIFIFFYHFFIAEHCYLNFQEDDVHLIECETVNIGCTNNKFYFIFCVKSRNVAVVGNFFHLEWFFEVIQSKKDEKITNNLYLLHFIRRRQLNYHQIYLNNTYSSFPYIFFVFGLEITYSDTIHAIIFVFSIQS